MSAIAAELGADLLILSTMVGGIFEDIKRPESRISEVTPASAKQLIQEQIITDGMIPKVNEALALLEQGVGTIAIANASQKGGFLALSEGDNSFGTRLIQD